MARGTGVYTVGKYRLQRRGTGWAVAWTDDGGVPRKYKLHDAVSQEQARQAIDRFARGQDLIRGKEAKDVATLWDLYLADRRLEGKRSVETMEHNWKALKPRFGHLTPAMIDKKICKEYADARKRAGRKDATILTELRRIRTALNWAVDHNMIEKAPMIWMPAEPRSRERWLTKDEVYALIESAGSPHVRLYIILAIATAARTEAILDLTWLRVDIDARRIYLDDPDRERTSKGRSTVPMNDMCRAALVAAKEGALTPFVIEWKQASVNDVKKGFAAAVKRAGIAHCTPHDLRRTAASWMVMAGVPIEEVARYLGHTSPRITWQTYGRFSPDYLQGASDAVNLDLRREVKKA